MLSWQRVKNDDGTCEYRAEGGVRIRRLAYDRLGNKFVVRLPKPHLAACEWEPRFVTLREAKHWADGRMVLRAVTVLIEFMTRP